MKFGIAYPNIVDGDAVRRFAVSAEALGFESLWVGDHIVLPAGATVGYPYTRDGTFQGASSSPFLEPLTLLSYIAACTSRIKIGSTVVILPYRHPVVQAKMFASMDVLTNGRVICGVGVGWLEKEFETLDKPFAERGPMTDEYLEIMKCLWTEDRPSYVGQYHRFDGITFEPKPVQKPHLPIWVGGHTKRAIRRTVRYGDAWHPTRQTPDYVADLLPFLEQCCDESGRDPGEITISLKRALHFTDIGIEDAGNPMAAGVLAGSTQQVIDDVRRCDALGIHQLTFDFRTTDADQCIRVMEQLAQEVIPALT